MIRRNDAVQGRFERAPIAQVGDALLLLVLPARGDVFEKWSRKRLPVKSAATEDVRWTQTVLPLRLR
ncbi:MAG TPA: hypothetical protein VED01_11240 [Burkholderiales bacterium]|nr:hypothetical protein [Burkholderiales bacterium]